MADPRSNQADETEDGYLSEDDVAEVFEEEAENGEPMDDDDEDMDEERIELDEVGEGVPEGEDEDGDQMQEEENRVPERDDSTAAFLRHKGSIFSVALSPTNDNLACSGGEDDLAWLWKVDSGEDLFQLQGHTDSVIDVAFNCDGKYVATAGMDGVVMIWNAEDGKQVVSLTGPSEITWINWHPKGNVLLAGTTDFTVWMWAIPSGTVMNLFSGHGASVTCGQFTPDGKTVVTGAEDGIVIVWDPKTAQPIRKHTPEDGRWHQDAVTCMTINKDSNLLLTGSADSRAVLTNLTNGRLLSAFEGHTDSVEAVGFSSVMGLAATGATDGKIMLWDLATFRLRQTCQHDDAVTKLRFHSNSHRITTSSADRTVRTWDSRTGQCESVLYGHTDVIMDMALSKDGKTIVTGSDDTTALVFTLQPTA